MPDAMHAPEPGLKAVAREPEVPAALAYAADRFDRLEGLLSELEARLCPVLRDAAPTDVRPGPPEVQAPLAQLCMLLATRLDEAGTRVAELLQRLEV